MQNVPLLKALGRSRMPVMLKRGFGCTIDEWIHAAEYILHEGNPDVVLCERGIRTFETATRFTLDVAAVPIAKAAAGPARDRRSVARRRQAGLGREPHPGRRRLRAPTGCSIETHPDPKVALSDGPQAVVLAEFPALMEKARRVAEAMGRSIAVGAPACATATA